MEPEIAVSIEEAARRAGLGRSSIYEAVNRGELPMRKLGKRSLILVSDLTAWIDHLPLVAPLSAAA